MIPERSLTGRIPAGTKLGSYEVTGFVGAGGMGEVYRAKDLRLSRTVALKVLPASGLGDAERKRRFIQEARAASALNHPNIVTLFDVISIDGQEILVLEYVAGKTLGHEIPRKGMRVKDALNYSIQITDALACAHAAGIVHRDIKPANIMITGDGSVRVLDFGLAKSTGKPIVEAGEATQTVQDGTVEGSIVGTLSYMSPEQAEGKHVDTRSDIFSFGVMFYEMLTGRRCFQRDSSLATLSAVLRDEPKPIGEIVPDIPPELERVITRCLRKDLTRRAQNMADVKVALQEIQDELGQSPTGSNRRSSRPTTAIWIAALCLALVFAALALWWMQNRPSSTEESMTFEMDTVSAQPGDVPTPQVSPDGRSVAFISSKGSGKPMIWLRSLSSLTLRPLPNTDDAGGPFWSHDGRWLGFTAGGKLRKVDLAGGPRQTICDFTANLGAAWLNDQIIFSPSNRTPLFVVSAAGGEPRQLTTLRADLGENSHRYPVLLPDGKHFLYVARAALPENTAIWEGSLDSPSERKKIAAVESNFGYSATGHLLFMRDGVLVAQEFDEQKLQLHGPYLPVADHVQFAPASKRASFSVSANGRTLVYMPGGSRSTQLTWIDRNGTRLASVGSPGEYEQVRLSPNGKFAAMVQPDPHSGNRDVWVMNLDTQLLSRFTSHPSNDWWPVWSPDGSQIAFASDRAGAALYRKSASGGSDEQPFPMSIGMPTDWSANGQWIAYEVNDKKTLIDLWVMPTNGGKVTPYLVTTFNETDGHFSPDGKWLAYASDESGANEIYVRPFPNADSGKARISKAGGTDVRWRRDGSELFYVSADGTVMAADWKTPAGLQPPVPKSLFHICSERRAVPQTRQNFDVSSDGKRFLFLCDAPADAAQKATVIVNWESALKQ